MQALFKVIAVMAACDVRPGYTVIIALERLKMWKSVGFVLTAKKITLSRRFSASLRRSIVIISVPETTPPLIGMPVARGGTHCLNRKSALGSGMFAYASSKLSMCSLYLSSVIIPRFRKSVAAISCAKDPSLAALACNRYKTPSSTVNSISRS